MNIEEIKSFLTLRYGYLDDPYIIYKLPRNMVIGTFKQCFPEDYINTDDSLIFTAIINRSINPRLYSERLNKEMDKFKDALWLKMFNYEQ